MTVQTEFWDWGRNPLTPDPQRCAPLAQTWTDYLLERWGGQNLGCYAPRPVIGGSTPSDHASGAATDWRYEDPGIGRDAMLAEVMPWLIGNSRELGLQAIHDYVGCRIWRPPGTSGRPTSPSPECGWRAQTPGSQMGQPWAQWLHLACLNTRWADTRTVDDMLPTTPTPEDDMPAPTLVSPTGGTAEQNQAVLWWDGRLIGWVRDPEQIDVGRDAGVYQDCAPRKLPAAVVQRMIDTSWAGGPTPPGFKAPAAVNSSVL